VYKFNPDVILAAAEESMFGMQSLGFCLACGEESGQIEPDAEKYECEQCGERKVYSAEQMLIRGFAD